MQHQRLFGFLIFFFFNAVLIRVDLCKHVVFVCLFACVLLFPSSQEVSNYCEAEEEEKTTVGLNQSDYRIPLIVTLYIDLIDVF